MGIEQQPKTKKTHDFVQATTKALGAKSVEVLDPAKHALKTQPSESEGQGVKLDFVAQCQTQSALPDNLAQLPTESDPLGIFVGMFGKIPRWRKGSLVQFAAYAGGYPAPADAVYAAQQLNAAAIYWNNLNVGVTFKWVGKLEDAEFVLGYGGDQAGLIARAFFPNANDLNNLNVYKRAFQADIKSVMWRYFLHELGHVLGLRHEFAMDPKPGSNPPVPKEGGAVQLGPRDAFSVMNYRAEAPTITQNDIASTKAFYNLNGPLQGVPLQLFVPNN